MADVISVRATITKVVEGYSVRVVIWGSPSSLSPGGTRELALQSKSAQDRSFLQTGKLLRARLNEVR